MVDMALLELPGVTLTHFLVDFVVKNIFQHLLRFLGAFQNVLGTKWIGLMKLT